MKLFICELPIEFPRTEYGGMVVIAANNEEEMIRILEEAYDTKRNEDRFNIDLALREVTSFDLVDGCDIPAGIVRAFET